eukprot:3403919-Alexandrium_andersonii.AAC.1
MKPNSEFRIGLDALLDGTPLAGCTRSFREQVASFRFVVCVETTIEAKHGRVTQARRSHHIGPVR